MAQGNMSPEPWRLEPIPHGDVAGASSQPCLSPSPSHAMGALQTCVDSPAFISKALPHPYRQPLLCPLRPRAVLTGDVAHPWETGPVEEACSGSGSGWVPAEAGSSGSRYVRPDLEEK